MEASEYTVIVLIAVVNLAAGLGCAVPIAKSLREVTGRPKRFFRYFAILIAIYFVECVAFAAGMATQVFSIGLAFVWGIVFGLWLRRRASALKVLKTSFFLSLYSSLPTASFGFLALLALFVGEPVLSAAKGASFGIPGFVPWPMNTILGFFGILTIVTIVFKTVITTGIVSLLIHLKKEG